MTEPHPSLPAAFYSQDETFAPAFSILQEAIMQRAFPAASVSVTHRGRLVALKTLGTFTYAGAPSLSPRFLRRQGGDFDSDAQPPGGNTAFTADTLFDLASLTKVVATTPMAMLLYQRALLDLDAPVSAIIPEFISDSKKDPRRHQVTLRMLLAHSSGLPAYEKLFLKAKTRDQLLQAVFTMPLAADPATRADYSDIGFILLGVALERLADEPLDRFCQREIFAPLAMTNTTFNPPAELRAQIPPTADERLFPNEEECGAGTPAREILAKNPSLSPRSTFRDRIIQGEVQDENAHILGGIAPHAGLFSTAHDLAKFAHALLNNDPGTAAQACPEQSRRGSPTGAARPIFRPETVSLFTRRESTPPGTSRALGWDTPSTPSQSGKYFSPASFGHLGYTGTSLWIDPTRHLSITLLTHRTWPDAFDHRIKQVRPKFHDAIIEALNK